MVVIAELPMGLNRSPMDLRLYYKPLPTNIFILQDNILLVVFQYLVVIKQMGCLFTPGDFRLSLVIGRSTSNDPDVVSMGALTIIQVPIYD